MRLHAQALMHAPEAERIIEQLAPMTVQDVGNSKWTAQGQDIQRLNLQVRWSGIQPVQHNAETVQGS